MQRSAHIIAVPTPVAPRARWQWLALAALLLGAGPALAVPTDAPASGIQRSLQDFSGQHQIDALKWQNDLEAALAFGAKNNRPLALYFTSPGCTWCQRLDAEVLQNPEVRKRLASFVLVKIDISTDEKSAARFRIRSTPTLILLTPEGRETIKLEGFVERAELLGILTEALGNQAMKQDEKAAGLVELLRGNKLPDDNWPDLMLALAEEAHRETILQVVAGMKPVPREKLVQLLEHPFLAVRLGALEILEELAGEDFGFSPWLDSKTPQSEALARWKAWAGRKNADAEVQHFQTLTADDVAGYLRDLLGDDADRASRARRLLQRGGPSALAGLNTYLESNPDLPPGTANKLREVRYSLVLPVMGGTDPASFAHRLVFGNLDVRLRTLREIAAARKRAVPVLKDFLADPEPLVRETTVDALVTAGGRSVVPLLEEHLKKETDANVVFLALKQLGNLPSKLGLEILTRYLDNANEDFVVVSLESVGKLKSGAAAPQVEKCLGDPRWRVRVAALKAVQLLHLESLAPKIKPLLTDPDAFVRGMAVETLANVAAKDSVKELEALFLKDDALKAPIMRALGAADVPVSQTLVDALRDKPPSVWLGILDHVQRADAKMAPLLEAAARHPDADVACAALRLMATHGLESSQLQKATAEQIRTGERRRVLTLFEAVELEEKVVYRYNPDARKVSLEQAGGAVAPAQKTEQEKNLDSIFGAFDKPAKPATAPAAPAAGAPAPSKPAPNAVDDLFKSFDASGGGPTIDFFQEYLAAGRKAVGQSADRDLQLAGAAFLIQLGDSTAASLVLTNLEAITGEHRVQIARHLNRVRKQEAVPLIRRLLSDPAVEVRTAAAVTLLDEGADAGCLDLLFAELTRENAVLRPEEVYQALHNSNNRRGFSSNLSGRVLTILQRGRDDSLTTLGLMLAQSAWEGRLEAVVRPFVTAENPWHRRAALYTLGKVQPDKFAELAPKAAADSSEYVRAVVPAIYRVSGMSEWVNYFDEQHTEENYDYVYGRTSSGTLAPPIKDLLKKLANDPVDQVRFQAIFTLLTYREPVDLSELVGVLERLPRGSAMIEQLTEYVVDNYQSLGKNFGVLLPYLNLAGHYRGVEKAGAIESYFGANEDTVDTPALLAPAQPRQRVEANFVTPAVSQTVASVQNLRLVYFFKPGCALCEQARRRVDQIRESFPGLVVAEYDITKTSALLLNETLSEKFGVPANVRLVAPAIFGGAGYLLKDDITVERLGSLLSRSATVPVHDWLVEPQQDMQAAQTQITRRYEQAGLGLILAAGLLDGINPCAFATIIFLLSYLQVARKAPRAIAQIGVAYIVGVFAAYFITGLGLVKLALMLNQLQFAGAIVNYAMAAFALVIMALSVRDGIYCLRGQMADMTLQLPGFLKDSIHRVIRSGVRQAHFVLMAFLMGVAISLLELACTGQVYLPTITYMIQQGEGGAVGRLLLYNLAFIAPLTAIFILAYSGLRSETLLAQLKKRAAFVKFGTALLFFCLFLFLVLGRH